MRNATFIVLLLLVGCAQSEDRQPAFTITLATTTSTRDSGLLDELLPVFEKQTRIHVKVVAVGSGQAMAIGRRGDADVLLTHAPAAELEFMKLGHGSIRRAVMHNDFVLVGPKNDPAKVKQAKTITDAFTRIANAEAPFLSRGDNSGTHMKEKQIWKTTNIDPSGDWYLQAGTGMAHTLRIANDKRAYTLTDRGTYLAQLPQLDLIVVSEGDALLYNPYTVIVINPENHLHVQGRRATQFADFLVSPVAQEIISKFGVSKYGQPLFFPDAESVQSGTK